MPRSAIVRLALVALGVGTAATLTIDAQNPAPAQQVQGEVTIRVIPEELADTSWLQRLGETQIKAAAAMAPFHDFRFTDRQAGSGITFRHRIVDDAGKSYKAAHYDHGNGLAIADVDGDGLHRRLLPQPGRRQPAVRRTWAAASSRTSPRRPGWRCRTGSASPRHSPTSTTTATRISTSPRFAPATCCSRTTARAAFRDITAASGLSYTGHSSSAVFFDYDRDGRLDLFLVNVGRYTTDEVGGAGYKYYVAFEDAFSGHLKPERAERASSTGTRARTASSTSRSRPAFRTCRGRATPAAVDVNDDGWPDLYVLNMQGDDEYYENAGGKRFVRKSRTVFPRTSWGAMGIKVFDVNNDGRLDIFITDMHSDMSEPIAAGAGQAEVDDEVAGVVPRHRQDQHLGQHAAS